MTPFAEDVLEQAPDMARFFYEARFFDLNTHTDEIFTEVKRFAHGQRTFKEVTSLPEGAYWFECSGFENRRCRIGFACTVQGIELTASLVIQEKTGKLVYVPGLVWLLFSKIRPLASAVAVDGVLSIDPIFPLVLVGCIENAKVMA